MSGTKWCLWLLSVLVACGVSTASLAQQGSFPFESELLLDVRPMPGSKRIPNMDVAADTITVMVGQPTERQCPPERARADADFLVALNEVTTWRRQGDAILLIGPKTLRFRLPTN